MIYKRANSFIDRCHSYYEKIQRNPTNLDEFCKFIDNINELQAELDPLSMENQGNMTILYLCQAQKMSVSEEQTRVCTE